jgi:hypothetical protein
VVANALVAATGALVAAIVAVGAAWVAPGWGVADGPGKGVLDADGVLIMVGVQVGVRFGTVCKLDSARVIPAGMSANIPLRIINTVTNWYNRFVFIIYTSRLVPGFQKKLKTIITGHQFFNSQIIT